MRKYPFKNIFVEIRNTKIDIQCKEQFNNISSKLKYYHMIILFLTVCKLSPQSISIIYYLEWEGVPNVGDLAVVVALSTQSLSLLPLAPGPAARLPAPAVAAPRAEPPGHNIYQGI